MEVRDGAALRAGERLGRAALPVRNSADGWSCPGAGPSPRRR